MDNKKLTEAIDEYKEGSESAFITIFNESADELLDFAEDLSDDKKGAQDLLRQTYVSVAEKLKNPDDDEDFFRFAEKKMLDIRGMDVSEKEKDGDPEDQMYADLFDSIGSSEAGGSDVLVDENLRKVCQEAVEGLSYRQKIAAHMYYGQGKTIDKIAGITGASDILVKSWLYQVKTVISGAVESYVFDNDLDTYSFDYGAMMRSIEKERLADGTFEKAPVAAQIVLGRIAGDAGLEDDAFDEFKKKAEKVDAAAAQRKEQQELEERQVREEQKNQVVLPEETDGGVCGDDGDGNNGKSIGAGSAILANTSAAAARLGAAELANLKAAPEPQAKKNFFQEKLGKIFDRSSKAGKSAVEKNEAATKGAAAARGSAVIKGGAVAKRVAVMLIAAGVAGGGSYAGYHYYQGQLDPQKLSKSQVKSVFQDINSSVSPADEMLKENAERGIADSEVITYLCGGRWGIPGTDNTTYSFKKDGTGTGSSLDGNFSFTWSLEGNEITMKIDGDSNIFTYDSSNHTLEYESNLYYREDQWDKIWRERYADDDSSQTDDSYSDDEDSDVSDSAYDEDFLYSDENWKY